MMGWWRSQKTNSLCNFQLKKQSVAMIFPFNESWFTLRTIQANCCMGAVSASVFGPHFVNLKLKNCVRDSSKQMGVYLILRHQKTTGFKMDVLALSKLLKILLLFPLPFEMLQCGGKRGTRYPKALCYCVVNCLVTHTTKLVIFCLERAFLE